MKGKEYFPHQLKKNGIPKLTSILLITASLLFLLFSGEQAFALTTITWGIASYTPQFDDAFGNIPIPITFTVDDSDLAGNAVIDTISVLITSSTGDSTILTLVEDGADNGMFTNTKLIFMYGNNAFGINDETILTIFDDCSFHLVGNCDPNVAETVVGFTGDGIIVGSNSEPGGIALTLTETGPDTSLFTTVLKFSTVASDPITSTLLVSPGDTITVLDEFISIWLNGLITPASVGAGAISVEELGTVTASYNGISQSVNIDASFVSGTSCSISEIGSCSSNGEPGRGGGGAIRPGLVLNFIAGGQVLCNGDCTKPTLGLYYNSQRVVENGFSYNGNPVNVETFYTPYPMITTNVGQKNIAVLKIYENSGPQQISHVGLAFGLAKGKSISESKAVISWDRNIAGAETVSIKDPENTLQDVSVVSENGSCATYSSAKCLILTVFHTFRQPLEFNMVGTNVWDNNRNAKQNYFNHGVQITGKSLNPPKQITLLDYRGYPALLTLADKDHAIDEKGNSWLRGGEYWVMEDYHINRLDKPLDAHGINRNNDMFYVYKKGQELLAEHTLNKLVSGKPIHNIDFGKNNNKQILWNYDEEKYNIFLQQKIDDEIKRSKILVEQLFDIKSNY